MTSKPKLGYIWIAIFTLLLVGLVTTALFRLRFDWQRNSAHIALFQGVFRPQLLSVPVQVKNLAALEAVFQGQDQQAEVTCRSTSIYSQVYLILQGPYPSEAVAILKPHVDRCPADTLAWYFLGQVYLSNGEIALATQAWKQAGASIPLSDLGDKLAKENRWQEAGQAYQAYLELRPGDCVYMTRLGNAIWHSTQNPEPALALYKSVIQTCSNSLGSYVMMTRILIDTNQWIEAGRVGLQAQKEFPNSELPLNVLALLKVKQGYLDEALNYLKLSMQKNPNGAEAHALMGSVYFDKLMYPEAERELGAAIQLDSGQAWYYLTLGQIYLKQNMKDQAEAAYQKVLVIDPGNADAKLQLSQLQDKK